MGRDWPLHNVRDNDSIDDPCELTHEAQPSIVKGRDVGCSNTKPFLCNELGPFQAISGNWLGRFSGDFRQLAWAFFRQFLDTF